MSKSKCCEVITGKGQRCIQEGKYAKEGHLVCGLHQFTKRPIKYIPCKPEEEKVDIVTNILEKRFHDPIDIPCAYCEAAKEIVNLISPTPSQETLENCGTECHAYKDCQVWHGNPTIKHLCPLIKSLPSQELLLTDEERDTILKKNHLIAFRQTAVAITELLEAQILKVMAWRGK